MQEVFEPRDLIGGQELAQLTVRGNARSSLRLALQLAVLVTLALTIVVADSVVIEISATIALAAVTASMFAPFHECTHSTAFASRRLSTVAVWIAALPFGMSPTLYRDFHFAHHRHTQDPSRDPELLANPELLLDWPKSLRDWLIVVGGWRLLRAKLTLMGDLWFFPARTFERSRLWARKTTFNRMKWETRFLSLVWASLPVGAIAGVPGFAMLTCALLLSHLFQSAWLSSEHTGLPTDGGILERTRSVLTPSWIRWFLWNMNYHAEHHGWPAVPWYRLGELHGRVGQYVRSEPGYVRLHRRVWREMRDAT